MKKICALSLLFLQIAWTSEAAVEVWKGQVSANGSPSQLVSLELGKKYKIVAKGSVNLGKWWQQGMPLAEDACYEYNPKITPEPHKTLQNSLNISVCDGKYHDNHTYQSEVFEATQNRIHFWIYDTDYSDNTGSLEIEVIEV